jgi:hypothetical protein
MQTDKDVCRPECCLVVLVLIYHVLCLAYAKYRDKLDPIVDDTTVVSVKYLGVHHPVAFCFVSSPRFIQVIL